MKTQAQAGFSLLEALVALFILSAVIMIVSRYSARLLINTQAVYKKTLAVDQIRAVALSRQYQLLVRSYWQPLIKQHFPHNELHITSHLVRLKWGASQDHKNCQRLSATCVQLQL